MPKTVTPPTPGKPLELVLEPERGVVTQEEGVVFSMRRSERDDLQNRGRFFVRDHALGLDGAGQLRHRGGHAVLHEHLREVRIGPDLERHDERIVPIVRARRLHVEHALDAVDLLLDRQRHRFDQRARARAGIARRDLHGGRRDRRVLRNRKLENRDPAEQDHEEGDNVREDRPLNEEFGKHVPDSAITSRWQRPARALPERSAA